MATDDNAAGRKKGREDGGEEFLEVPSNRKRNRQADMQAKKINVVMGGPSAEYEVSLNSGQQVLANLDRSKYTLRAVVIDKQKRFYYADVGESGDVPDVHSYESGGSVFKGPFLPYEAKAIWDGCDAAFLALHGEFGEDGVIQGYLETIGVPYTGPGVYSSAVAMNKITTKFLYELSGLTVPPYSIYGANNPDVTADTIIEKHGFPCFLKCPQSGSSRLMGRATDRASLESLLKELRESADDILVETSISGIEFSCGVVEMPTGEAKVLPPIEIIPAGSAFFDYTAKYTTGKCTEIVPAQRPPELLKDIQTVALRAHNILGCRGESRTDMIYADSKLYVLETNTLPGMTSTSLLPKAYKAQGGTYAELLDVLISSALRNKRF